MQELLVVDNLETSFMTKSGALKAVEGVSYTLAKGETVGIVGESGCGKTVTSLSIMRLLGHNGKITGGKIVLNGAQGGMEISKFSDDQMRQIRGTKVAMIFQEPMTALNPVMTIGRQIAEQVLAHKYAQSKKEAIDRAIEYLKLVGIPSPEKRVEQYPHQLSGGMRQRAMIAMALSCDPDLLIADEPTTALDVTIQAQILDLILSLQDKLGMGIQFITHDLGVISEIADRVIVMYAGKVVETGSAEEIFSRPRHPYTVGLMDSIPKIEEDTQRLRTIEGVVPPLSAMPPGCRFQNRCSRASDECKSEAPPLLEISAARQVACFNPVSA